MSVEMPAVESEPHSWEIARTELSHGFLVRFIGHDITDYKQVNDLHHRVRTVLEAAEVESETCDNAELIVSELAANTIEHGLQRKLTELDLTVFRRTENSPAEVSISVINPATEDTRIESNPSMTDEQNKTATSGRGGIITDALSEEWGYSVERLRADEIPEENPSLIVYARLGAAGLSSVRDEHHRAA